MIFKETSIPDLYIVEPSIYRDPRGYFMESFREELFVKHGFVRPFVQDNQSMSGYGVVRGLHYQLKPHGQAKLVRVFSGRVLDVAVDLRKGSPTFGKWEAIELNSENNLQLFIPRGFAHGFAVLSETAEFFYKCDGYYAPEFEAGIRYDDPDLQIDWQLPEKDLQLSEKDKNLPLFKDAKMNFEYQGKQK